MTRSLGDMAAKSVGVIWNPEVKVHHLDQQDKFMIIASDGIWEFISNKEALNIVSKYWKKMDVEGACDKLIKEALKRWG